MNWATLPLLALVAVVGCGDGTTTETVAAQADPPALEGPAFQVDASWLKTPDN